jgi:tetratricopeptide (TPR) repeat protein
MGHARANSDDIFERGLIHARAGRHGDAIACFETAIAVKPGHVGILFALGNTAAAIGHKGAAETFFRRVLDREPDRIEALVQVGNLLRAGGRAQDAIALLKPAIERNPGESSLWLTLGSAVREAGDSGTAEVFYSEALRLCPQSVPALGNLADLLADKGHVDEALAVYGRALEREPKNAQARLNRAILFFLKGDLAKGWRDYEYRLEIKSREIIPGHDLKRWNGAVRKGLKLLVTAEQGIGDQIMFASLIPELASELSRNGGYLVLEAEPRLVALFARSFENVVVKPLRIEERGGRKYSVHPWLHRGDANAAIELGSLPRFLRRDLGEFPAAHAYLRPCEKERARLSEWLRGSAAGPIAGLCWRSGLSGGLRDAQFAPLSEWAEFIRKMPFTPVSLQYDAKEEEVAALKAMSGRDILVPDFDQKQEIDRAAALMASLDCVVSAPTSVAWISAAIGVPTFKILRDTAWTAFGENREPFAPAARIVAPEQPGDWHGCLEKALAFTSELRS